MIPTFPKFKPLEWNDRIEVLQFTNEFPLYSDFNFSSMYSWNTRKKMMLSILNNNLVLLFNDYITEIPFLTFIGKNDIIDTALKLIDYSNYNFQVITLKLIPEHIAIELPDNIFIVKADEDSFDYIISVEHLSNLCNGVLAGTPHNGVRMCRNNQKLYPNLLVKLGSCMDLQSVQYLELFKRWAKFNCFDHRELNEYSAFERFIHNAEISYSVVSIFDGDKLIGFSTYEILSSDYAISHFVKGEKEYKGIYERLNFELGKELGSKKIKYINFEQDLGIQGLRQAKRKYKPEFYLKKYIVEKIP